MKLLITIVALICAVVVSGNDDRRKESEKRHDHGDRSRDDSEWRNEESKGNRNAKRVALSMDPVLGHFNLTGKDGILCLRMDSGIRLDITYEKKNGSTGTTTIVSDNSTSVSKGKSVCWNGTIDHDETLGLYLSSDHLLRFDFTREQNVTGDSKEQKWQLYRIRFQSKYNEDFPDAKHQGDSFELQNNAVLKEITGQSGKSYGCSKLDPIQVADNFKVTLTNLRVQPFMTSGSGDFGQADWCAIDQTSDLIPIIIGAALAALVIIVLIAYLVGRARSKNATYDNI